MKGIYLLLFPLFILAYSFGFELSREDFFLLFGLYGLFFLIGLLAWKKIGSEKEIFVFIIASLLLRFMLVFAWPILSDDFYRFAWDGRLILHGVSPYSFLPSQLVGPNPPVNLPWLDTELYWNLNSRDYFSVYPPVNQFLFWCSASLFPESVPGFVKSLKCFFLLFEAGTIFIGMNLLKRFKLPAKNILLYALNPLIILESFNNLHFEILMIFFLALTLWMLSKDKWKTSALWMGFATGTKLIPLIFMPFFYRRLAWKKLVIFGSITAVTILVLFLPAVEGALFSNFGNSLELYFRKFEFNGSIYYLLRWLTYQFTGFNTIATSGPLLALATVLGILFFAKAEKDPQIQNLAFSWMVALTIFLALATTVHPWYLSGLIFLCIFTPYRYPVVWSFLIFLTYVNYSGNEFYENLWIVGLEYILLLSFIVWQYRVLNKSTHSGV